MNIISVVQSPSQIKGTGAQENSLTVTWNSTALFLYIYLEVPVIPIIAFNLY